MNENAVKKTQIRSSKVLSNHISARLDDAFKREIEDDPAD